MTASIIIKIMCRNRYLAEANPAFRQPAFGGVWGASAELPRISVPVITQPVKPENIQ